MARVHELSAEGLQMREAFQLTGLGVGVADRADRAAAVAELELVAPDAGRVTVLAGEADARRVGVAAMAKKARHPGVIGVCVSEAGVILVRRSFWSLLLWLRGIGQNGAVNADVAARVAVEHTHQKAEQSEKL